jgi:hypothetical protein
MLLPRSPRVGSFCGRRRKKKKAVLGFSARTFGEKKSQVDQQLTAALTCSRVQVRDEECRGMLSSTVRIVGSWKDLTDDKNLTWLNETGRG